MRLGGTIPDMRRRWRPIAAGARARQMTPDIDRRARTRLRRPRSPCGGYIVDHIDDGGSGTARRTMVTDGYGRALLAAKHAVARGGEPADQPVRLDGVVHPGSGPAMGHARFNGLLRYFAAIPVEQRELSAGLRQSALEIAPLRLRRPYASRKMTGQNLARCRDVGAILALRCPTHGQPVVNDD